MLSRVSVVASLAARSGHFTRQSCVASRRYLSDKPQHDPLRVLFCGADEFSIYSLKALNKIREENPEKVASIDVVCRKDKRVGRGLKQIREGKFLPHRMSFSKCSVYVVPIKSVAATELGLNVHQIDTFTGWTPPQTDDQPFNMVVAVSFGLLVPPRILNAAKYGGLNVHPSMLPDLPGPAPLHHTLLRRLSKTGVTLQTLHPKHFDQGRIIDQTPSSGLSIPDEVTATLDSVLGWIGPLGADMLYNNIMNGNFATDTSITPSASRSLKNTKNDLFGQMDGSAEYPRHARKIIPEDRHVNFRWPSSEILLRNRVLGRLFALDTGLAPTKRITFHGFEDTTDACWEQVQAKGPIIRIGNHPLDPGAISAFKHDKEKRIYFRTKDGWVSPTEVTLEGSPKQKASVIYEKLRQTMPVTCC
ncbi:Formyltransferase [Aureobasidium pullulans]|nr:Formyltransferase [Aureobasidium pullulans]